MQAELDDRVHIERAVAIRFLALAGIRYQLQSSNDLFQWMDFGEPVLGTGDVITHFVVGTKTHEYFRAVPLDE